jgi:hypothetical protein
MNEYFYIITKIEVVNYVLTESYVGYVVDGNDAATINATHYDSYTSWIGSNINDLKNGVIAAISYFDSNPVVFHCNLATTCIDGMGLTLITDINNL